jgi:hypothetical protein
LFVNDPVNELIIAQKHEFPTSDKISVLFQTISLKFWVVVVVGIVNTTESEIGEAIKDKNTFHMAHFIISRYPKLEEVHFTGR